MSNLDALIQDLVIANRILAREEVVDAYGHVSVRHPNNPYRFLIARSLAPELVRPEDIVELDLDGQPVRDEDRHLYLERFIHAAIFAARPDVMAVVHAHAEDTLPFGIAQGTFRAGFVQLRQIVEQCLCRLRSAVAKPSVNRS
jgi:ribulose-5-phosphate 4-epimerase/fuculose-1-phosphate aldolase